MRSTEFVLSLGSAVAAQWRLKEDGSISISINCALKVTERLPSWTRAERNTNDSREIIFELQVSNAPSPPSQAVDLDGTIACKDKEEPQRKASKLREKIASHWENTKSTIAENVESWKQPTIFFAVPVAQSNEAWSYRSLQNAEDKLHNFQAPFHKVCLAYFDRKRTGTAKKSERELANCRRALLDTIHIGYKELPQQKRDSIARKYSRSIDCGNALRSLCRDEGLLLTIGPVLSLDDCKFISQQLSNGASVSDLLGEETVTNSRKYNEVANRLCTYLTGDSIIPQKRAVIDDDSTQSPRASTPLRWASARERNMRNAHPSAGLEGRFDCWQLNPESDVEATNERPHVRPSQRQRALAQPPDQSALPDMAPSSETTPDVPLHAGFGYPTGAFPRDGLDGVTNSAADPKNPSQQEQTDGLMTPIEAAGKENAAIRLEDYVRDDIDGIIVGWENLWNPGSQDTIAPRSC